MYFYRLRKALLEISFAQINRESWLYFLAAQKTYCAGFLTVAAMLSKLNECNFQWAKIIPAKTAGSIYGSATSNKFRFFVEVYIEFRHGTARSFNFPPMQSHSKAFSKIVFFLQIQI